MSAADHREELEFLALQQSKRHLHARLGGLRRRVKPGADLGLKSNQKQKSKASVTEILSGQMPTKRQAWAQGKGLQTSSRPSEEGIFHVISVISK